MVFTSDLYSGLQNVLFLSVFVSDRTDNLLVSLNFFSVTSFSVEATLNKVFWHSSFALRNYVCDLFEIEINM